MSTALNSVCPYFTMFPLRFPLDVLTRHAKKGEGVLDPFAGRGTTLYAGRLLGLHSFGIDSNPVAVAISEAKLANSTSARILAAARGILNQVSQARDTPNEEFWQWAFHEETFQVICRLREGLLANCGSNSRKALRAIMLGALHGPLTKSVESHFSNQCPRTYAPKPGYAVKFWKQKKMKPPRVDVLKIIERRAKRYFDEEQTRAHGWVVSGDSQKPTSFDIFDKKASWILTSPPYYGMRTYVSDQWLRYWFTGGPPTVDYSNTGQLSHNSPASFASGMREVWRNCARQSKPNCRLVIRFGAINDRKIDALGLVKDSLNDTPWRITTARRAGTAAIGKRQADHFVSSAAPIEEYDVWACKQ